MLAITAVGAMYAIMIKEAAIRPRVAFLEFTGDVIGLDVSLLAENTFL